VTLLPLGWLLAVTVTAGLMKIFSPAPLGFLAIARGLEAKIAAGGTPAELTSWGAQLFNNRVDAAVTAIFLILVAIVLVANARVWWQLLSGRRVAQLREEPYVAIAPERA
jgi:carbon starvation protein